MKRKFFEHDATKWNVFCHINEWQIKMMLYTSIDMNLFHKLWNFFTTAIPIGWDSENTGRFRGWASSNTSIIKYCLWGNPLGMSARTLEQILYIYDKWLLVEFNFCDIFYWVSWFYSQGDPLGVVTGRKNLLYLKS